jgi:diadenosine tetraphosphate (Ap4A) HIT family hydrolase
MPISAPRGHRIPTAPPSTAPTPTPSTALPSTAASAPTPAAEPSDVFDGVRDMKARVGGAQWGGATVTKPPALLPSWRQALLEAEAEERADDEIIALLLVPALRDAERAKGDPLSRREMRLIEHDVRSRVEGPWKNAYAGHLRDVTASPTVKKQVERDVVFAHGPRVDGLRDPFTPVIAGAPGARDNEIVLWESRNAIVLVDTFAPSPKALVIPKAPARLPTDLSPAALDELGLLAAHVSDAFVRATGCPPAGMWINPPQHLTVRQLHVHVLPDIGVYTADGSPARALLEDASVRPQLLTWFDVLHKELVARLGTTTRSVAP